MRKPTVIFFKYPCPWCGADFQPYTKGRKKVYCSRECQVAALHARDKQ